MIQGLPTAMITRPLHLCAVLASVLASAAVSHAQARPSSRPVVYEGARLIVGDGSAPIESGVLVVERYRAERDRILDATADRAGGDARVAEQLVRDRFTLLQAIAAAGRTLTWQNFWQGLVGATRVSCMIMFILAGAAFLTKTMAFTGIPKALAEAVAAANLSPYSLIAVLVVVYLVLGTALDGISMIVLTSAVVLPMIQKAGFDLIWFGIFIIMLVEIAEVSPPVGFNLFVLQNMTGKDSNVIAKAALPFFGLLVLAVIIITIFPEIVMWLPDVVMGQEKKIS